jgi:hypothetical protein
MKHILKAGIAALALFSANNAQAQPPAPAQPLADLMKWEGKWAGEAVLKMEGKTYTVHYTVDFEKTADGSGIQMMEGFSHPELGTLVGQNLIGYNNNDGKIHWFSVDNFGTSHEHLGMWKAANHFYMEARENQKGKKFVERIDANVPDAGTLMFRLVGLLDGKVFEEVTCTFHRVNG